MLPAGMVVGARLGGGSGQQGCRQSDWNCKVSRTVQACNAAVTDLLNCIPVVLWSATSPDLRCLSISVREGAGKLVTQCLRQSTSIVNTDSACALCCMDASVLQPPLLI